MVHPRRLDDIMDVLVRLADEKDASEVCREGVTRTVWLVGPWAVKVPAWRNGWPFLLRGLIGNMNEANIWEWSGAAGWGETALPRRLLAPVLWAAPGGLVLVMRRADRTATVQEFDAADPLIMARMTDAKPDNLGIFPDGARVVDYADGWDVVECEMERRGLV